MAVSMTYTYTPRRSLCISPRTPYVTSPVVLQQSISSAMLSSQSLPRLLQPSVAGRSSYAPPAWKSGSVQATANARAAPSVVPRRTLVERDLRQGQAPFDPTAPATRAQLNAILGLDQRTTIEAMKGFTGGLNSGVWFVKGPCEELVLKLVDGARDTRFPTELTEADNLMKVCREHPSIMDDPSVAFPRFILHLLAGDCTRRQDLIVMPKARGTVLTNVLTEKLFSGRAHELMPIFERVGVALGEFHKAYMGKQHGDMQPHNIVYDAAGGCVTFIDVAGIGCKYGETDAAHFLSSLSMLAVGLGPQLEECGRHFKQGYTRVACGR